MNRSIFVCALMLASSAFLGAQQTSQSNPYAGISHPPANDTIVDMALPAPTPARKPSPEKLATAQPARTAQSLQQAVPAVRQAAPQAAAAHLPLNYPGPEPGDGTDYGMVLVAPDAASASSQTTQPAEPSLNTSSYANNPDGDIVHPAPLPPGELSEGTNIYVRLLQSLSTGYDREGDAFRTEVISDVTHDGQVLIPAGSEIDGTVERVSLGHFAGRGSIRLRPETITLPDGSRYQLFAQVFETAGSSTYVNGEGTIFPISRVKKDGIEYGAMAGGGAVVGAVVAGPVGALAGTVAGASAVTAHLLLDHPQPSLETGTMLVFSLTQPLSMVPAGSAGN